MRELARTHCDPSGQASAPGHATGGEAPTQAERNARGVFRRHTPIFRGINLAPGATIAGPAIIEEPTTTIVVYPDMRAVVSPSGHYLLYT